MLTQLSQPNIYIYIYLFQLGLKTVVMAVLSTNLIWNAAEKFLTIWVQDKGSLIQNSRRWRLLINKKYICVSFNKLEGVGIQGNNVSIIIVTAK